MQAPMTYLRHKLIGLKWSYNLQSIIFHPNSFGLKRLSGDNTIMNALSSIQVAAMAAKRTL